MKKKIILFALITFLILAIVPIFSMAATSITLASNPIDNPNAFKPGQVTQNDINMITGKTNNIVGIIVTVGVVISVITLIVLGIKYMIGSVEEKAEYKKSMIPYLIGAVLLFSASILVNIIAKLVQNTSLVQ